MAMWKGKERIWTGWVSLVFLNFFVFCAQNETRNQPDRLADIKQEMHIKPPSSYNDTLSIDLPSAVFYNPDSGQLEKIRAITDSGIFESQFHECYFLMRNSRLALQSNWPEIKILETKNTRFLFFRNTDGEQEYIDLDTYDPCGLFLFDGRKKARLADMANIDSELSFYFEK
jgi:hypothetical protein